MLVKWQAEESQGELSDEKDNSIPTAAKSQVIGLCKCEASPSM